MPPRVQAKYPLRSVESSLALLLLFRERELIRVGEAAQALGVVPSTAHRLLSTLRAQGFVRQDPATRAYAAGPALLELGLNVVRGSGIQALAHPKLKELAATSGETTHLIILDHSTAVFVDSVESSQPLRTGSRIGFAVPAHCASGGKALLAELSVSALRELYPKQALVGCTARSLKRRTQLEAELASVRKQGYALNMAESEADIHAIGVAIKSPAGRNQAAIAVSGPSSRLNPRRLRRLAPLVQATAAAVGEQLV